MITAEQIRQIMSYDPEEGIMRWRRPTANRIRPGDVAGSKTQLYYQVTVLGKAYVVHRLVWLYVHGRWPVDLLDHINGDGFDNRLRNLRECTKAQNSQNHKIRKDNNCGHTGVYRDKEYNGYIAHIGAGSEQIYLGYFPTLEEAVAARQTAAVRLHGDFARVG